MKRTLRFPALFLILVLLFSLASCNRNPSVEKQDTPTITILDEQNATDYLLIRGQKATASLQKQVEAFRTMLSNVVSGTKPKEKSDYFVGKEEDLPAHEILIGNVNRTETRQILSTLAYDEYVIAVVNEKLVITGGCDAATLAALNYFSENLFRAPYRYEGEVFRGKATAEEMVYHVRGEESAERSEPYPGVTRIQNQKSADSLYGQQDFHLVEFNPADKKLQFFVTCYDPEDITRLAPVSEIVSAFEERTPGIKVIDAINGDLWMNFAHARVLGSGTSYGGYSDAVVTKMFNVLRSFDVYDGEIVSSAHIRKETPYEDPFYSFGLSADGKFYLGCPQLDIQIRDGSGNSFAADGLNRLPVDDALILYSHRVGTIRSLDDAYEVVLECGDYTVQHGKTVTGTVSAIYAPGGEEQVTVGKTQAVLCARGSQIARLQNLSIRDSVSLTFSVSDAMGNDEAWQNMLQADGGHYPIVLNGESQSVGDESRIPTTLLGLKENGNVVFLINDGRQSGYSQGFRISDLDMLCAELGIVTAFVSDGGGSSTLVELQPDGSHKLINTPSDKNPDGTFGYPRSVAGCVLIAYSD